MKKRITAVICAIALIAAIVSVCASALANDVDWHYDSDSHTLYITGSGDMEDYSEPYSAPWGVHLLDVRNIIVQEGVKSLGNYAFAGATSLSSVTLADSVEEIGEGTFSNTNSLLSLTFSPNVVKIGDLSFAKIGADDKQGFTLNVNAGSFALHYAIANEVNFSCDSVKSGVQQVEIKKNTGMKAYFPFTSPVNGTFSFYSVSKNDPLGYVYDSDFNLLADNDDHGSLSYPDMEECDFSVSITLEKGHTYYFATKIYSPVSASNFSVYIIPTNYHVTGSIYALLSPDGTLSENTLSAATLNGEPTGGTFSIDVPSADYVCVFSCDGATYTHVFTPEDGDSVDIAMVMCDVNEDFVVNAKDYVIMKRNNSAYQQYFTDFLNYKYEKDSCYIKN